MRTTNKTGVISFAFVLLAALSLQPAPHMKMFTWLRGTWTMKTKNGTLTEYWHSKNDSTLQGSSKMVSSSGKSDPLESLQLIYESGSYYYISNVNGQNEGNVVRFRITSHDNISFVAENPGHDFPKRITYRLLSRDSLHAFIDGGPTMTGKRSDFYFSRVND